MHGTLSRERLETLQEFRSRVDVYFDTGDGIKAGNLAIPLRPDPVWPMLAELNCTASVPGNRESHVLEGAVRAKFAGVAHPVVCANWRHKDGSPVFAESLEIVCRGVRIAVFGVMVPIVTARMKTAPLSAYLWEPPLEAARRLTTTLRPRCDLLIALTHVGFSHDKELASACPEIDVILGGHSHTVWERPQHEGHVAICQGGSHNRFAGIYEWTSETGLTGQLHSLQTAI